MNSALFKQGDSRWGGKPYPTKKSTFAGNGCGCAACTHLAIEQDRYSNWTPENLRTWMINQGFAVAGQGTTWSGITKTLEHLGYKVVHIGVSDPMSKAWTELNKRNRIGIILFKGGKAPNGTVWTAGGHYVAFTDYYVGSDGRHYFYTKDSGGRNHDSKTNGYYSYERSMKGLVYQMWIVEKIDTINPTTYKPTTPYTGTLPSGTVKEGADNADSKAVQQFLNWCIGTKLTTGKYGEKTVEAAKIFQKTYGLKVDGIFGSQSKKKAKELIDQYADKSTPSTTVTTPVIAAAVVETPKAETSNKAPYTGKYPAPKKYLEKGDKGTSVTYLQEYLNWYTDGEFFKKCGPADGTYGNNTLTYVKQMQSDFFGASEADGKVGAKTIEKMKEYGANPNPQPVPPTPTPTGTHKGMDISAWQGNISVAGYQKAINYGIKFVILRVGYTGSSSKAPTIDKVFENNYKNAIAAGLPVGIYYYSLATSTAKAKTEADWVVKQLKGRKITYPVYIDMEDNATQGKCSKSTLASVCNTFCDIINAAGYTAGVYASTSWFNSKIGNITSKHTKWVAQYYKKCEYKGAYDIWQYSSSESVPGIASKTDVNWCYKSFSAPDPKPTKSVDEVAKEVLEGKWGAGDTRKNNLINAGYDYNAVQSRVNEIIKEQEEAAAKEEAKKLSEAKESAKASLESYKNLNDYRDAQKEEISKEIANGKSAIDSVTDINLLNNVVEAIKHRLDNIKTNAQLLAEEEASKATEEELIEKLAKEVLEGKWGSGDKRKANLEAAGYDYYKVQAAVNRLLEEQLEPENPVTNSTYTGELPTTKLVKSNAQVIADACKWAAWIAGDNRFHYGYTNKHGSSDSSKWSPNAHHNGCYFCGTNVASGGRSKKGITDYKFTYCCNPFVGAAWAHGGGIPKAMSLCQDGSSWDYHKGKGYDASSLFTNLGKPKKANLKKGDVCCNDSHVFLYLGDGKLAEASGGDDNKRNSSKWNNSIHVISLSDSKYKGVKRVHRYNSSVDTTAILRHGEVSDRIYLWEKFLNWYFDGALGKEEGIFGDVVLKYTKMFQEQEIGAGQGDGLVGEKTLEAARKAVK